MAAVTKGQQNIPEAISPELEWIGYEQLTGLSTVKAAAQIPSYAPVEAMIQASGQDVRWSCDGTDPSSTHGMTLPAGQTLYLRGLKMIKAFKAKEITASATLDISYWG